MIVLGIDTSSWTAEVALLLMREGHEPHTIKRERLTGDVRASQTLAPAIGRLMQASPPPPWKANEIQLVCVCSGPGSFTGLRLGVTTAKVFAYAAGAKAIGVNTLDVIARNVLTLDEAPGDAAAKIHAVMDAQRKQVFAASYRLRQGVESTLESISPTAIHEIPGWLEQLAPGDLVIGPGLEKLEARIPPGVTVTSRDSWQPDARVVGVLGWQALQAGAKADPMSLMPNYFRQSAAEEKRAGR